MNALCLSTDAERWMKSNLDISYKDIDSPDKFNHSSRNDTMPLYEVKRVTGSDIKKENGGRSMSLKRY
jgi:hypothetical protein